jgi:hypothetical protein
VISGIVFKGLGEIGSENGILLLILLKLNLVGKREFHDITNRFYIFWTYPVLLKFTDVKRIGWIYFIQKGF